MASHVRRIHCMLRAILVGLLTVSSAMACKGGGDAAPKVEPGVTVGKVVELVGTVTATRDGQTRTLDKTSAVSGDDVIATQGDGRVTILLAHNNARWDLGPNKHERVADSLAWGLARADQRATAVDETTTAAGRHAERSAATGEAAATTGAPPAATDERRREEPEAPAAGGEGGGGSTSKGGTIGAGPPPVAQQQPQQPSLRPPPTTAVPGGGAPPTKPPAPKAPRPTVRSLGKIETQGDAPPDVQPKPLDEIAPKNEKQKVADVSDPLQTAIEKERAALHACVVAAGVDKVAIVFHVAKGTTTIEVATGTDKDRACFAKIAARIKLSADQTSTYPLSLTK